VTIFSQNFSVALYLCPDHKNSADNLYRQVGVKEPATALHLDPRQIENTGKGGRHCRPLGRDRSVLITPHLACCNRLNG
jgi:hypothetical protein